MSRYATPPDPDPTGEGADAAYDMHRELEMEQRMEALRRLIASAADHGHQITSVMCGQECCRACCSCGWEVVGPRGEVARCRVIHAEMVTG